MSSKKKRRKDPQAPPEPPCQALTLSGSPCISPARFGDPLRWCANHDPAQVERRAKAGQTRRPRFGGKGVDPRTMPTVDFLVDYAIDLAESVARGELEPDRAQKAGYLLRTAIDGLKARAHVGDLQPASGAGKGQESPEASPESPAQDRDPIAALEEGLEDLDS